MKKSEIFQKEISNVFYVDITWTPTTEQENTIHKSCFSATNSAGLSTTQVCIDLLPGHTVPEPVPIPETIAPDMGLFHPCDITVTWNVNFDRDVERPLRLRVTHAGVHTRCSYDYVTRVLRYVDSALFYMRCVLVFVCKTS